MKSSDIFDGITEIRDEFIEEAAQYRFGNRRRLLTGWISAAAAVFLIGTGIFIAHRNTPASENEQEFSGTPGSSAAFPETGAVETGGTADMGSMPPSSAGFVLWNYNGPILPLTAEGNTAGIEAERHVHMDFAESENGRTAAVTDTYTLRNTTTSDITMTAVYPFVTGYSDLFLTPTLLPFVSGTDAGAVFTAGEYCGSVTENQLNLKNFEIWEDYAAFLADGIPADPGDYTALLSQSVTVYEIFNQAAKTWMDDKKIRMDVTYDPDVTEMFTYYMNGITYDREKGTAELYIHRKLENSSYIGYSSYVLFFGENTAECTLKDPSLAELRSYTVTFEEILRKLIREDNEKHTILYAEDDSRKEEYNTFWEYTEEEFLANVLRHLTEYGAFSHDPILRYHDTRLDDILTDVRGIRRIMTLSIPLTIPAGESAALTFDMAKEASVRYDNAYSGLQSFDLAVTLGSVLSFTEQTVSVSLPDGIVIAEQDFGLDPASGITEVSLDLTEEHLRIGISTEGYPVTDSSAVPPSEDAAPLYAAAAADLSPWALPDGCPVRTEKGLYLFDVKGAGTGDPMVWYPVFRNGKITQVYYANGSEDTAAMQYANAVTDTLTALAHLTSAENPLYLTQYGDNLFAVIGKTAYRLPDGPDADIHYLPEIEKTGTEIAVIRFEADENT